MKFSRSAPTLTRTLLATALACSLASTAQAETLGMVVGLYSGQVTVFDADTDTVRGSIALPNGGGDIYDCSITDNQSLGMVSSFGGSQIYVVDPKALTLAAGTNQIPLSFYAEDITLSDDQKYLLVSDGGGANQVSVVDIAARAEIGAPSFAFLAQSVEACSDNSVLVTDDSSVHRLAIDAAGNLTDTGESSPAGNFNSACAKPGGSALVVADSFGGNSLTSVLYPPLTVTGLDTRSVANAGTVVVSASGTQAYVRSYDGQIQGFSYDPVTGALGASPFVTWPVAGATGYFGVDQMAIHSDGSKLYVSEGDALNVYDTASGALITTMTDPGLSGATGVCLPKILPTSANLRIGFSGPSTPVRSGTTVPVYARVDNYGRDAARNPVVNLTANASTGAVSATAPTGWTCQSTSVNPERSVASAPVPLNTASFRCTANAGTMPRTSVIFTLRITAPASAIGSFVSIGGTVASDSIDPVPSNNAGSFKLYVKAASNTITPVVPPNH